MISFFRPSLTTPGGQSMVSQGVDLSSVDLDQESEGLPQFQGIVGPLTIRDIHARARWEARRPCEAPLEHDVGVSSS